MSVAGCGGIGREVAGLRWLRQEMMAAGLSRRSGSTRRKSLIIRGGWSAGRQSW